MVEHTGVKWQGPKTKWVMVRCESRRIMFFVGLDHDKEAVFIDEDNDFCWLNEKQIDELPDCTGFDYVPEPEPVYPIWCVPPVGHKVTSGYRKEVAYYRYDSKNSGVTVHKDGSSFRWNGVSDLNSSGRRVVTQQEAKKQVCERACDSSPDQHKPTSRTIGADGNDEREAAAKLSGPEWITMFEIVREGALGREVVWVEHPGGLWQTGQTRFLRVK